MYAIVPLTHRQQETAAMDLQHIQGWTFCNCQTLVSFES